MKKLLFLLLLLPLAAWAVDPNGYTSEYECRAGGPQCNVDIATLTQAACDQTITTATAPTNNWSALNQSNTVICIQAGDHTGRGTLTLTTSGTSGTRKVLRYTRVSDNNDEPWNQTSGNRATVAGIVITGNYWVIHRLYFTAPVEFGADNGTGNNNIANRIFATYAPGFVVDNHSGTNVTLQNSVVRNTSFDGLDDRPCVGTGQATNFRVINNEIYDCQGDEVIFQTSGNNPFAGGVVENNDLYITSALYHGDAAWSENAIDIKGGGTSANPVRFIHNRMWGHRDTSCSSSCGGLGSAGESIIFHTTSGGTNSYGLIQNNIIMDGSMCISVPNYSPDHWSIVGNICYDMRGPTGGTTRALALESSTSVEVYLNTFISTVNGNSAGWLSYGRGQSEDIRCNVAIDSGTIDAWGSGTSTQLDYNVYYNATHGGETNKIDKTLTTRANSTAYSLNQVIRLTSTAPADGTSGDFLYIVTTAGTTAGSPPTYPVTLGASVTDGTAVLKAIRGPYSFRRKLRTVSGGEAVVIPYADTLLASALPEYLACPSGSDTNAIGERASIGINNIKPPNPPFDTDLVGTSR
jgi:hypothetical protein